MARTRRPTQTDIARAAGVSPAVVSLVINGRTDGKIRISDETQARVRQAIRDLGYVPNLAARQLAGGRNRLIGVFTYEPVFPLGETNFYYPFLVGIEEEAEALGYDLLLFTRNDRDSGRRLVYRDGSNALQVADGAVLLGTNEDRSELARLVADGFPFVFAGRREIDGQPLAYVGADYAAVAGEVVDRLAAAGHRTFRYLTEHAHLSESGADRLAGFKRGLARAGIDPMGTYPGEVAVTPDTVAAWLDAGVTAFVTQTLALAQAVIRAAAMLGHRPPTSFSIAALGNSDDRIEDDGTVTSIDIPQREMGAGSVRLLVDMIERPDDAFPRQVILPCRLRPGITIGPVPTTIPVAPP
jgi:DNA-binding LacI/PurR family transcriptional regulator